MIRTTVVITLINIGRKDTAKIIDLNQLGAVGVGTGALIEKSKHCIYFMWLVGDSGTIC